MHPMSRDGQLYVDHIFKLSNWDTLILLQIHMYELMVQLDFSLEHLSTQGLRHNYLL